MILSAHLWRKKLSSAKMNDFFKNRRARVGARLTLFLLIYDHLCVKPHLALSDKNINDMQTLIHSFICLFIEHVLFASPWKTSRGYKSELLSALRVFPHIWTPLYLLKISSWKGYRHPYILRNPSLLVIFCP